MGEKLERQMDRSGHVWLAVNDARGTYEDNEGEYEVTISIE